MSSKLRRIVVAASAWLVLLTLSVPPVMADPDDLFAPVFVNRPTGALYFSHCDTASYTFQAVSAATGLPSPFVRYRIVEGPGTIDSVTGEWKVPPTIDPDKFGTYSVEVAAREFNLETEGLQDCFAKLYVENRNPIPYYFTSNSVLKVAVGDTGSMTYRAFDPDRCDEVAVYVEDIRPDFTGTAWFVRDNDEITLNVSPNATDSSRIFDITFALTDGFITTRAIQKVQVLPPPYYSIRVGTLTNQLQGTFVDVPIYVDRTIPGEGVGGFDLLLAYETNGLSFQAAFTDSSGLYGQCEWEYFTYRFGANGNCNESCPAGLLRVVGLAETNNGAHHPTCPPENLPALPAEICRIEFLISNNREIECNFLPIKFFFVDCSDNSISSAGNNRLYLIDSVYERGTGPNSYKNVTVSNPPLPSYQGLPSSCLASPTKYSVERGVRLYGGGVDIICADTIDEPCYHWVGIPWPELIDYVVMQNYFLCGHADSVDMVHHYGLHCLDFNGDGNILNLGDLVAMAHNYARNYFLIRGGESPNPANLSRDAGDPAKWNLSSADSLGAMLLVFDSGTTVVVPDTVNFAVTQLDPRMTRVLYIASDPLKMVSLKSGAVLEARIDGRPATLLSAKAANFSGQTVQVVVDSPTDVNEDNSSLPKEFALHQNYPNPFNPSTIISLDLPHAVEVNVEIINVIGQVVWSRQVQMSAGTQTLEWGGARSDGSPVSSGVYYYRLRAADFVETKKMILMK